MKIKSLTVAAVLFAAWNMLTGSVRDPNNPPAGRTGAPGETTCAASGCHSGGTYTGTVSISGIPDTITANQSYVITLTHASNAVRAGFELTCLDNANVKCGTLTAGTGTSVATSGGRQYVRQSAPKTLSNGSTSWSFTWKAPASISGNQATFYFASLAANGNGNKTGDNPLLASRAVVLLPTVAAHEPDNAGLAGVYPAVATDVLNVELLHGEKGRLSVFDMQGKVVLQSDLVQINRLDISRLDKGLHIAQITVAGRTVVKKFVVE